MSGKIEVLNFHNLSIENTKMSQLSTTQSLSKDKNLFNVVFIRNPYDYFNYLLGDYLKHKKSILFTNEIATNLKKMNGETFIQWLHTLSFIPFYNPQIFQLDLRKRLPVAMKTLEKFDYVVPYEEMDVFLENVATDMTIGKEEQILLSHLPLKENKYFNVFIEKDLKLYERSLELWDLIKKNNFKALGTLIERKQDVKNTDKQSKKTLIKKYKGVAGHITEKSISGWVFNEEKEENIGLEIYRNNTLLCVTNADKLRKDLKERNMHPTGKCGFEVIFETPTFQAWDQVEIKILPENILLPLGPSVKKFLKGEN